MSPRWRALTPLVLGMAVQAAELGLVAVMFPAMARGLGLAVADLGLLTAAGKVTASVFGPVWVWLTGRWSRTGMLVVSAALSGIVTFGIALAEGLTSLLLLCCILAALCSGVAPMTTTILADLFEDRSRGRAVGVMYASLALFAGVSGAVLGQFTGVEGGWRTAYMILGGLGVVSAGLILAGFRDPGLGAADARHGALPAPLHKPGVTAALGLFRIPTFVIMMLSRLLSGHLVIGAFGVLFLTSVRQFPNETAALVLVPFGAGVCIGNIGGAFLADWLHARAPGAGRVAFLQAAQFAFAAAAYVAIGFDWQGIGPYLSLWMALGLLQGVNPSINRPIVLSVVRPELRSWAFIVMLAIVEPAGWAALNFGVSRFGGGEGLRTALLVVMVGAMVLNGLAITPLYRTYRRDSARARLPAPGRPGDA